MYEHDLQACDGGNMGWMALDAPGAPDLGMVVPRRAGNQAAVGRKGYVVDLLLVAMQARDGLGALAGAPEINSAVIAGRDESVDRLFPAASSRCCLLEAFAGEGAARLLRLGHRIGS